MIYMGSKARLAKYLAPIIQSYITEDTVGYLEPFVGGANMIQHIKHYKRFGSDIHPHLIALLEYAKDLNNVIPDYISEDEYNKVKNNKEAFPDWYNGLIGFCCSFGCKYYRGYARSATNKNVVNMQIRSLLKQRELLQNINFKCIPYQNIKEIKNFVIYCDPPYYGTEAYKHKFDHTSFWEWVRKFSINNTVLVSEYTAPGDFVTIFEKEIKVTMGQGETVGSKEATERLFKWNV